MEIRTVSAKRAFPFMQDENSDGRDYQYGLTTHHKPPHKLSSLSADRHPLSEISNVKVIKPPSFFFNFISILVFILHSFFLSFFGSSLNKSPTCQGVMYSFFLIIKLIRIIKLTLNLLSLSLFLICYSLPLFSYTFTKATTS